MAKKKRRLAAGSKPRGHFCKVCGEHKANEKFSGKGHAAPICKTCADLTAVYPCVRVIAEAVQQY